MSVSLPEVPKSWELEFQRAIAYRYRSDLEQIKKPRRPRPGHSRPASAAFAPQSPVGCIQFFEGCFEPLMFCRIQSLRLLQLSQYQFGSESVEFRALQNPDAFALTVYEHLYFVGAPYGVRQLFEHQKAVRCCNCIHGLLKRP